MSVAAPSAFSARRLGLPGLCVLLLALAMVRVPVAFDVNPDAAHRGLLYENIRLGRNWAEACLTPEGPLTALQAPAYLGGSIWMTLTWQVAGNLLLAGVLIAAAWRLSWSRRLWALAALAAVLARWPELAGWLVMVLLGRDLVRAWDREPPAVLPAAGVLGLLSLFSLGHLALGVVTLLFLAATPRPPLAKGLAATAWLAGLVTGWLVVGQSLPGLWLWLRRGFPLLAETSPAWRQVDLAVFAPWATVTALGFAAVLVLQHRDTPPGRRALPGPLFLAAATWLAWRTLALPAHGTPLAFFATVLLAAFLLWTEGGRGRWVAALALLAATGLARGHPEFLSNALGNFNRRAVVNWRRLTSGAQLRNDLRAEVASLKNVHAWPRLRAAVGSASVGVTEDALGRALLNGLSVVLPAGAWTGDHPPEFVIEGMSASIALAPALVDAPAQLALYRRYELVDEEAGFRLWRRQSAPASPAPGPGQNGTLAFGEPLRLPAGADGWWLEVEPAPGLLGWLWSLVAEAPEPRLSLRDESGATVCYALPPGTGPRGFLVDPFVRGNIAFGQWQRGAHPLHTTEVTVLAPPAGALWAGGWRYRLRALPGLKPAGTALGHRPMPAYRAFQPKPVGSAYALPFVESPPGQDALFFAHPDCIVEFALTGREHRIRGSFGLAPGAYDRPGRSDGVDFSIEFIGSDGGRQVLFHRYLDPAFEMDDRGTPAFDIALPPSTGGRLLLRTFNPPHRSAAWDWAFWREVAIE